ncbi:MAG: DUF1080 domain-containing protein [Isosphaeraceae bacterium]
MTAQAGSLGSLLLPERIANMRTLHRFTGQHAGWGLALLPAVLLILMGTGSARETGKTQALFNGRDLEGWSIYIAHSEKSTSPGADPKSVFKVEDGVIHVSGEEFGCLITEKEFANYRLKLEVKWGDKKWPPREKPDTPRDSGILMHCVGPDKIWPKSIECQIQEKDFGDFYMVGGTSLLVNGREEKGRVVKTKDAEKPRGEWNVVEVVCDGGKITNIVNGVVVNEGTHASETRGKIVLQSEGAEVFFRNIELTLLHE